MDYGFVLNRYLEEPKMDLISRVSYLVVIDFRPGILVSAEWVILVAEPQSGTLFHPIDIEVLQLLTVLLVNAIVPFLVCQLVNLESSVDSRASVLGPQDCRKAKATTLSQS